MAGEGPFLWLWEQGPEAGFRRLPPGGMCLCAFLFVRRGPRILLGRYADDPAWEALTGLNEEFRRRNMHGWTIPATHLRFGEDPRAAARRVGEEVLRLPGLRYSEPRVEVDLYESRRSPGRLHYDLWFLVEAPLPRGAAVAKPPWYADLAFHDPRRLPREAYARGHEDVVDRWLALRGPLPAPRAPAPPPP